jgi:polyhydroxybutyrate depolymerase
MKGSLPWVILFVVILSLVAGASFVFGSSDREGSLEFDGLKRTYRVHVPASYDGSNPVPLVLVLHGGFSTGRIIERATGMSDFADKKGFIVVYPDGLNGHWNDGRKSPSHRWGDVDDVGFIRALITNLELSYNIDKKRVYACGISNGGMMSHRLGMEMTDVLAAIASIAGAIPERMVPKFAPSEPISVVMFHGTDDQFVPYNGGVGRDVRGGNVLSVHEAAEMWAKADRCPLAPKTEDLPDVNPSDGTRVIRETYGPGKGGAAVVVYTIKGGGHAWPGWPQNRFKRMLGATTYDIIANEVMWNFFERHPKR